MPVADVKSAIWEVSPVDPLQLMITVSFFIMMISIVSLCTCCGGSKSNSKDQDDCDYGVVTVASVANAMSKPPPSVHTINFRDSTTKRLQDRHSQPASNMNVLTFNRQSAPGRALPKLPGDLYTAIDKKAKNDENRFAYETINPMYECIDAETDSFVDPLYSKVGMPGVTTTKDRRYDYPIFSGRQPESKNLPNDDILYQSASQIYAAGSEDPYSSISERGRNVTFVDGDGDTSSAYDPGYAKVKISEKPGNKVEKSNDKIERTERELDLLYSKIRRTVPNFPSDNQPGPSSRVEPPTLPTYQPVVEEIVPTMAFDAQSGVSSREPSYRYITMRENAEIVRERLRQQGQLDRPVREHYYSTIGNEYETINNAPSTARMNPPQLLQQAPLADLDTMTRLDAPPPPTSPIPERSRPVSFVDTPSSAHIYSGILKPPTSIPPPPDLRCSPVPPRPSDEPTYSINGARYQNESARGPDTYRSMETLIGKRTMEEKETIVEQRSTFSSGMQIPTSSSSMNMMSRSVDNSWNKPIHEVKIRRLETNYDGGGPGVDVIISGRRYRSGPGLTDDRQSSTNPTQEISPLDVSKPEQSELTTSFVSSKDDEASGSELLSSTQKVTRKRSKKEETEEEKIQRLGTVYTANDYICPLDMTDERPWPMNKNEK